MRASNAGVTLLEMLVVIVVLGIGLSVAVPSFTGVVNRNQATTDINEFVTALNLARSEATTRSETVSIQAIAAVTDNEFGGGWCVIEGDPGNCTGAIRTFPALSTGTTLSIDTSETSIPFNALGELADQTTALVMTFCAPSKERRISIGIIGRSRIQDAVPTDCP